MSMSVSVADPEMDPETELSPKARRAIWGAFVASFVDIFDLFLPTIALGPAIYYFVPKGISPLETAIVDAMFFAAALIGRPLGSLIFGHFADTLGRKRSVVISAFGFGVVTLVIAALPGYQYLGGAIIWIFILLRFIDGIFLGGQYTTASPLAMEYSPKSKRGLYGGIIQSASPFAVTTIAILTLLTLLVLPSGDLHSPYVQWGWRIPFFIGSAMGFALGIYYHVSIYESNVWEMEKKKGQTGSPLKHLFRGGNLKTFVQVFVLMSGYWLLVNASIAAMPGLLTRYMGVRGPHLTLALVVSYIVVALCYILGGALSQRIGRRKYLLGTAVLSAVLGSIFYYVLLNSQPGNLSTIVLWTTLATLFGVLPGALGTVYVNERFHTGVRASGFGLGYSLAIIPPAFYVFYQAGLAHFIPFKYTVIVLVVIGATLVFIGAAWGPETKDIAISMHESESFRGQGMVTDPFQL